MVAATWLWQGPGDPRRVVEFARRQRLAEVFVNGAVPGVAALVDGLRAAGVAASGLGGDPRWVFDHAAALDWYRQRSARARFTGIHVDVEPWTLPEWDGDRRRTVTSMVALMERLADRHRMADVDLPGWLFDVEPVAAQRILRMFPKVTVMAYRDRARDILAMSAAARRAAGTSGRSYRIAVETMPVSETVPAHITFADDGAAVLTRELAAVDRALAHDPRYRGLAVHHQGSWAALGAGYSPST
ncbi:hypothetical protein GCM10022231_31680 [Gordonia caeni]|uniref:ChbG/HpnK family deacetylase n=1 Tax=Gordonia caeni TaxID=1007097 RepID=A0ABP7PN18_9ACTN